MKIPHLHDWAVDISTAKAIQLELQHKIMLQQLSDPVIHIAGADVAYSRKLNRCFSAVTVYAFPEMEIIEQRTSSNAVSFPYVPGYLTFREAPVLLSAFEQLITTPDLIFFDGQGIAHPRKMGIASHLGVILDLPTIGCAKSRLVGEYELPANTKGSCSDLIYKDKRVGAVVRTRTGVKPVFISPGNKITINEAVEWTLKTCTKYRIPDPIRQSHIAVNQLRLEGESKSRTK